MPEQFALGQREPRIQRRRVPLDAAQSTLLRFGFAARTFLFRLTGGLSAGQVYVLPAYDDQARSQNPAPGAADWSFVHDPVTFPILRVDDPCPELWLWTAAPAAGQVLEVYALRGDAEPASGGGAGGSVDVNTAWLYGPAGRTVVAAAWDTAPVAVAGASTGLLLAGSANYDGFLGSVWQASANEAYWRRTATNANAGLRPPSAQSGASPVFIPGGGTAVYGRNASGGGMTFDLAAIQR